MPYENLVLPDPPGNRPFVFMNMVCTIDGKIVTGERDEPVMDLGSAVDYATMRHLESLADAVLIGAGSLRATPGLWYPKPLTRIVVTSSGNLPWRSRFFTDCPEKAHVISVGKVVVAPGWSRSYSTWDDALVDFYARLGVRRLLVEGGSELNAELLSAGLIDELFLTVAPKVKLGRDIPTIAGGQAFAREEVQSWNLVSVEAVADEVFLRYRKPRAWDA